ncbi:cyclodeaminase [Roseibium denhamense]|uniref:Ornithine cyclodeaminase n=1 Tax=Roseibium denhamense TaxID=76305 RepID=A0ABY1PK52_9HYPH|nr:cyclodeaminase [Roseibium denhamense]MTI05833.1 cyclodeaminase [Roseibium denhamense]SMP35446.1 ornithine cyclodeaminase [Roseibium denhamense]
MPEISILTETELRKAVPLNIEAIEQIERAFAALASGQVVMPPILSMEIADFNGEVDAKTAYVPGLESFAFKVSPGFFDNPKIGLPSNSGLMILFSAKTGFVEAVMLDNGYLTEVRTAAAGAVAAKHLAVKEASRACIVGAGLQARLQLQALCLVRPITHAQIWARVGGKGTAAAAELSALLGIEVTAADDLSQAVREADVIVTTTPSTQPLISADWLRPGQHVTAMGSDQHTKNELDPECLKRADLYVPDRQSQTELMGELRAALAAGAVPSGTVFSELGDIVSGKAKGRTSDAEITICDLTGTGVQDTAIATFARAQALKVNAGTKINA